MTSSDLLADPRANLARALAETHMEYLCAEHDHRRLLNEGADHMHARYPAAKLQQQPEHLDHFSWHMEAMARAQETGGLGEVPGLPFAPAPPVSD